MNTPPRIVFMGTPDFAVPSLNALVDLGAEIAAVYTQPPAPRGRGQKLAPSPVEARAQTLGLPVRTPSSLKAANAVAELKALKPDLLVVVAYGQILTAQALATARLGAFNLHASLLPRWRGAAPIQRAIMAGDDETGVAVMRMRVGLDEGPILAEARTIIEPDDTSGDLHLRLAQIGAELWRTTVPQILAGAAIETAQATDGLTYARKITPEEGRIDWARPAAEVDRQIRGLSPFPGAYCQVETTRGIQRLKVLASRLAEGDGAPGQVLTAPLRVACGAGAVQLLRLQREGRPAGPAEEVVRGLDLAGVALPSRRLL